VEVFVVFLRERDHGGGFLLEAYVTRDDAMDRLKALDVKGAPERVPVHGAPQPQLCPGCSKCDDCGKSSNYLYCPDCRPQPESVREVVRQLQELTGGTLEKRSAFTCEVTGNPSGSDTWMVGKPCQCRQCQAYLAVRAIADRLSSATVQPPETVRVVVREMGMARDTRNMSTPDRVVIKLDCWNDWLDRLSSATGETGGECEGCKPDGWSCDEWKRKFDVEQQAHRTKRYVVIPALEQRATAAEARVKELEEGLACGCDMGALRQRAETAERERNTLTQEVRRLQDTGGRFAEERDAARAENERLLAIPQLHCADCGDLLEFGHEAYCRGCSPVDMEARAENERLKNEIADLRVDQMVAMKGVRADNVRLRDGIRDAELGIDEDTSNGAMIADRLRTLLSPQQPELLENIEQLPRCPKCGLPYRGESGEVGCVCYGYVTADDWLRHCAENTACRECGSPSPSWDGDVFFCAWCRENETESGAWSGTPAEWLDRNEQEEEMGDDDQADSSVVRPMGGRILGSEESKAVHSADSVRGDRGEPVTPSALQRAREHAESEGGVDNDAILFLLDWAEEMERQASFAAGRRHVAAGIEDTLNKRLSAIEATVHDQGQKIHVLGSLEHHDPGTCDEFHGLPSARQYADDQRVQDDAIAECVGRLDAADKRRERARESIGKGWQALAVDILCGADSEDENE
jgi:hypothetical protein